MTERTILSFELVSTATQQLMGLAAGIIALTVTFAKDYLKLSISNGKWMAIAGWVFFGFSIIFGQLTLLTITYTLSNLEIKDPRVNAINIKIYCALQIIFFLLGIIVIIIFASCAI